MDDIILNQINPRYYVLHHLRDIITYMLKVSIPCVVDVIASSSLSASRTKTCKIFLHGSTREFVTYEKDGTPLYFRITGEPISAAHLCEYFIENYKKWLTQEKYIKEHSELFGDDPTLNE